MNLIDVLVKLKAKEVAEDLCKDNGNKTVTLQNNQSLDIVNIMRAKGVG